MKSSPLSTPVTSRSGSPISLEGPLFLGSQIATVSSSVSELNTQSPPILGAPVLTQTVLESVRSARQSVSSRRSEESAGSNTSHNLLFQERIPVQTRPSGGWWTLAVAVDFTYGNSVGFDLRGLPEQPTPAGSVSLLNGRSIASTCQPCPSFPPIFPGIPATARTKTPTTTLASASSGTLINSATTRSTATSGNAIVESHGTPGLQTVDQSDLFLSVWARTGLHYEVEHRDDSDSRFWIPSVQQGAYRTETGLMVGNSSSISVSASTGIQRDTRNGGIERSVFIESAWNISGAQLWGNGPSAPLEGASSNNSTRGEMDIITGGGGFLAASQQRTQQHWILGNTLRSQARAGFIGAGLALAHTLGSVLGAWMGANIGFMAHGLAIGGSAAVSAVSAAFNAFTATRADQTVVVTDLRLGLPLRLRFSETEENSYLDVSIIPQVRIYSEANTAELLQSLEPTQSPQISEAGTVILEMERATLTLENGSELRSRDNAREDPENNDSRV